MNFNIKRKKRIGMNSFLCPSAHSIHTQSGATTRYNSCCDHSQSQEFSWTWRFFGMSCQNGSQIPRAKLSLILCFLSCLAVQVQIPFCCLRGHGYLISSATISRSPRADRCDRRLVTKTDNKERRWEFGSACSLLLFAEESFRIISSDLIDFPTRNW